VQGHVHAPPLESGAAMVWLAAHERSAAAAPSG
jgi:hypothetical protein